MYSLFLTNDNLIYQKEPYGVIVFHYSMVVFDSLSYTNGQLFHYNNSKISRTDRTVITPLYQNHRFMIGIQQWLWFFWKNTTPIDIFDLIFYDHMILVQSIWNLFGNVLNPHSVNPFKRLFIKLSLANNLKQF